MRGRERETDRERERQTDRERERETDRETERDREREREFCDPEIEVPKTDYSVVQEIRGVRVSFKSS